MNVGRLVGVAYLILSMALLLILFSAASIFTINGEPAGIPFMCAAAVELILLAGSSQKKMHGMIRRGMCEMAGGAILVVLVLPLLIDSIAEMQYGNGSAGEGFHRWKAILSAGIILFGSMCAVVGALHYRYRTHLVHGREKTDGACKEKTVYRLDGKMLRMIHHAIPAAAVLTVAGFLAWLANPLVIRWDKLLPYLILLVLLVAFIAVYIRGAKGKRD